MIKLSNERYEEIKQEVVRTFEKYKISCVPVSGYEIATKMGIKIITYNSLNEEKLVAAREISKDGFSLFVKGIWTIYLNDIDTGYKRQNSTLLHEIGHIVLNHTEDSEIADKEANFFAKYSLVPPILVYKFNIESIEEIEEIFEVSHQAACYAFDYYNKWLFYGGKCFKPYEEQLLILFNGIKVNI